MSLEYKYKGKVHQLVPRKDRNMEVETGFLNEDGFKRNLYKFHVEWVWSNHWAKNAKQGHGWLFTKWLNRTVERFRRAPYLYGHLAYYAFWAAVIYGLTLLPDIGS